MRVVAVEEAPAASEEQIRLYQAALVVKDYESGYRYFTLDPAEFQRLAVRDYFAGLHSPWPDILGPIKSFITSLWNYTMAPAIRAMLNGLGWIASRARDYVVWALRGAIGAFGWLWNGIRSAVSYVVGKMGDTVGWIWGKIQDVWNVVKNIGSIVWGKLSDFGGWVWGKLQEIGGWIWSQVSAGLGAVKSAVSWATDKVWSGLEWVADHVRSMMSSIAEHVMAGLSGLWEMLKDVGGWIVNGLKKYIVEPMLTVAHSIYDIITSLPERIWEMIAPELERHSPVEARGTYDRVLPVVLGIAGTVTASQVAIAGVNALHPIKKIIDSDTVHLIVGYGGGTALAQAFFGTVIENVVGAPLRYEMHERFTPYRPPDRLWFPAFARFKIGPTQLYEEMRYAGLDPDKPVEIPGAERALGFGEWYTTASMLKHPLEPDKWEPWSLSTWGEVYRTLGQAPASYFILNQCSRSGFYRRDLFQKALLDAEYGPLPMALILAGTETAFIKRHMTKYEDELNEAYLAGEIEDADYKAALFDIYPSEDMVNAIYQFFKGRAVRTRRLGIRTLCARAYASGLWDENRVRQELLAAGYKPRYLDAIVEEIKISTQQVAQLTPSQLLRIYQRRIWKYDRVFKRLKQHGYDEDDAKALMELYAPAS
ncbi:MAG: hypothetical protein JRE40_04670 [Deltaproteobacteria bacterium]|nr:hypothetical protein [Deltaproteobacteria bacterium]